MSKEIDTRVVPGVCPLRGGTNKEGYYSCLDLESNNAHYSCLMYGEDVPKNGFESHEYREKCWVFSRWFWRGLRGVKS